MDICNFVRFDTGVLVMLNKHLKNTKLYSTEFLRTELTSDTSDWNREYEP